MGTKLFYFVFISILFIASPAHSQEWRHEVTARNNADKGEIRLLSSQLRQLNQQVQVKSVEQTKSTENVNNKKLAVQQLELLIKNKETEQNNLKKDLQTLIDNPALSSPTVLYNLQSKNTALANEISDLKNKLHDARFNLDVAEKENANVNSELRELERKFQALEEQIENKASSLTEIVVVQEECIITQEISPKDCKDSAVRRAEANAVEIGGVSIINSLTEMVNFQITRDKVTRVVDAKITKKEVNIQFDKNAGDFGKYNVVLTAAVTNNPVKRAAVNEFTEPPNPVFGPTKSSPPESPDFTEPVMEYSLYAGHISLLLTGIYGAFANGNRNEINECKQAYPEEGSECLSTDTQEERQNKIDDLRSEMKKDIRNARVTAWVALVSYSIYGTLYLYHADGVAIYTQPPPPYGALSNADVVFTVKANF